MVKYNQEEATVTLSLKEYVRLRRADDWKDAVEAAGVNNWSGYAGIWSEGPPLKEEEIIEQLQKDLGVARNDDPYRNGDTSLAADEPTV